jgi:hypothetical protein
MPETYQKGGEQAYEDRLGKDRSPRHSRRSVASDVGGLSSRVVVLSGHLLDLLHGTLTVRGRSGSFLPTLLRSPIFV